MVANPYRWKAVIPQLENRNATAGCLLSVLFIIPYLAKLGFNNALLLTFVIFYVVLIVPLATGIISKKKLIKFLKYIFVNYLRSMYSTNLLQKTWNFVKWCHFLYIDLANIHKTTRQVVFNMAAERLFCPDQKLCCLFVLLFYSVLAYLQRALHTRPWAQLLNERSAKEFIKLTTAFIVARLGKGVAMSLVLITFTMQFKHSEPSFEYILITLFYFCVTQYEDENGFKSIVKGLLIKMRLEFFEGLESEWAPILLHCLSIIFVTFVEIGLLLNSHYVAALTLCYVGFVVPNLIVFKVNYLPLRMQTQVLERFPRAVWNNRKIREGQVCAICLEKMRPFSARVTPCGHLFHGACLRLCLTYSNSCPLCKNQLI